MEKFKIVLKEVIKIALVGFIAFILYKFCGMPSTERYEIAGLLLFIAIIASIGPTLGNF